MIRMKARVQFNDRKLRKKARDGNFKSLGHAGAAIRLVARRSIRRNTRASQPGRPPNTRRGQLKRAVLYSVEKQRERVVIGPSHAVVGRSAMAHEHGGRYRRQRYPKRPFMGPALMKQKDRLPRLWAGSVR